MKGNAKLLAELNSLLAEELTAINQYMVHSEMSENWGYGKMTAVVRKRAIDEMKHAEKLIERILFLEGLPIVSTLGKIAIGADIPKQLANDLASEAGAIKHYNAAIALAVEVGDNATKELLVSILKDEDSHVDQIEEKQDQISQMGLPYFLVTQTGG
jgi:bacterioferritin